MIRIGVIAALPAEARCLLRRRMVQPDSLHEYDNVWVHVAGIGADRAVRSAHLLVEQGVEGLVSWGTAGGLSPALQPGHVLVPESVLAPQQPPLAVNKNWQQRLIREISVQPELSVHTGTLTQSHQVLATPQHKQMLYQQTGALAVDMESYAVGQTATHVGLPFLVVRGIADPAGRTIPQCALKAVDDFGRAHLGPLLRGLVVAPKQLPGELVGLIRMGVAFNKALSTLTRITRVTGPDLGFPR